MQHDLCNLFSQVKRIRVTRPVRPSSRRFINSAAKLASKIASSFWKTTTVTSSGTSGMKSAPNGGINLSVLDGWWREGYHGNNGWAIGLEINNGTVEFQNEVDATSLYQLLENQIIPLYYAKPDGK